MRGIKILGALAMAFAGALAGCASSQFTVNGDNVRVIEKNREGMDHLALPDKLDGCEYLGVVRTSQEDPLEILRIKAAARGGDTLAILPGGRVVMGSLRGSVFRCGDARPDA